VGAGLAREGSLQLEPLKLQRRLLPNALTILFTT